MGFPGEKYTIKILRRIPIPEIRLFTLWNLRKLLFDDKIRKELGYLPLISAYILKFYELKKLYNAVTPIFRKRLVYKVKDMKMSKRDRFLREQIVLLYDLLDMKNMLGVQYNLRINSIKKLRRYHDDLVSELNNKPLVGLPHVKFPPPPMPGSDNIEPITNLKMLVREGIVQKNCVASWQEDIMRGKAYVYKFNGKERATIGLRQKSNGDWYLVDVEGEGNHNIDYKNKEIINNWFLNNVIKKNPDVEGTMKTDRSGWLKLEGPEELEND